MNLVSHKLEVIGLNAGYGHMQIVRSVGFYVEQGELVVLVGRNGAGKTTTLLATAGVRHGMNSGSVKIRGEDISRLRPPQIVVKGLGLVPEGRRIFREMTVAENLRLGAIARRPISKTTLSDEIARVLTLFPALADNMKRAAGQLSGGQQQMVAIGQALMAAPHFLLLDEPAAGLSPLTIDEITASLRVLCDVGLGVLIVEQNLERALAIADRCYAMDNGMIAYEGRGSDTTLEQLRSIILSSPELSQRVAKR